MRIHLWAGPNRALTVCGHVTRENATWDIDDVDCARCIASNYNRGQYYAKLGRKYLEEEKDKMPSIYTEFHARSLPRLVLSQEEINYLGWVQRKLCVTLNNHQAQELIYDRRNGAGTQRSLRERYAQPVTYSPRGRGPVVAGTSLATGVWVTYTEPKVKAWEQPIYDDIHIHDSRDSAEAIFSMGKGALIAYWPFGMSMDDAILAWNTRFDAEYSDCLRD